jgi:serine/threonine protein kinase
MKPNNICVGKYSSTESDEPDYSLKLIDFGLARPFIKPERMQNWTENDHIEQSKQGKYGNVVFASPDSMLDLKLSRRADLYSLLYMLIYIKTGKYLYYHKDLSFDENMQNIKFGKT